MTNHPSRNWRTRMNAACAEWLARWNWQPGSDLDVGLLTREQLRELMQRGYLAGYEAGRASTKAPS